MIFKDAMLQNGYASIEPGSVTDSANRTTQLQSGYASVEPDEYAI